MRTIVRKLILYLNPYKNTLLCIYTIYMYNNICIWLNSWILKFPSVISSENIILYIILLIDQFSLPKRSSYFELKNNRNTIYVLFVALFLSLSFSLSLSLSLPLSLTHSLSFSLSKSYRPNVKLWTFSSLL